MTVGQIINSLSSLPKEMEMLIDVTPEGNTTYVFTSIERIGMFIDDKGEETCIFLGETEEESEIKFQNLN